MTAPKQKTKSTSKPKAKPKATPKKTGGENFLDPRSSNAIFARRVMEERLGKGISQAAVAEATGFTIGYVSMLENSKRSPTLDTLDKLAKALRVRPATLLESK
jgi:ribosome-binding protein aMBF1 (putative translation factor)